MKRLITGLVASALFVSPAFADSTINNLGAGTALVGTEQIPMYQGSNPAVTTTPAAIKLFANTTAVDARTTTSEAINNGDQNKLVTFNNASAVACTIAQAGTGGNFVAGWAVSVKNYGAGTVTCTATTSVFIDVNGTGSSTITIPTGFGFDFYSDGTNYIIQGGRVPPGLLTTTGALKGNGSGVVSQAACGDLSNATALCSTTPGTGVAAAAANALSSAGGLTTTIASGTAALGTSAISSGTCATVVTVSAASVATTDIVTAGFAADPTATTGYLPTAMLTIVPYPTAGNVNFKVCNLTSGSITPSAVTINWRVTR